MIEILHALIYILALAIALTSAIAVWGLLTAPGGTASGKKAPSWWKQTFRKSHHNPNDEARRAGSWG